MEPPLRVGLMDTCWQVLAGVTSLVHAQERCWLNTLWVSAGLRTCSPKSRAASGTCDRKFSSLQAVLGSARWSVTCIDIGTNSEAGLSMPLGLPCAMLTPLVLLYLTAWCSLPLH